MGDPYRSLATGGAAPTRPTLIHRLVHALSMNLGHVVVDRDHEGETLVGFQCETCGSVSHVQRAHEQMQIIAQPWWPKVLGRAWMFVAGMVIFGRRPRIERGEREKGGG